MRIAFAGSSGTGKTTLARFVSETYGLPINPVGSRSVAQAMGFSSPYDVDRASAWFYTDAIQRGLTPTEAASTAILAHEQGHKPEPTMRVRFQTRLQLEKIAWELEHQSGFVTDRTSMDDMTYALLHCPSAVDRGFIERATRHMDRYHRVLFLPLSSFNDMAGDPARVADLDYQARYEVVLHGLLLGSRPGLHVGRERPIPSTLEGRRRWLVDEMRTI